MGEDKKLWFLSNVMTDGQVEVSAACRQAFINLFNEVDALLPEGRRKSVVITKLEEAAMMATKAISHG